MSFGITITIVVFSVVVIPVTVFVGPIIYLWVIVLFVVIPVMILNMPEHFATNVWISSSERKMVVLYSKKEEGVDSEGLAHRRVLVQQYHLLVSCIIA